MNLSAKTVLKRNSYGDCELAEVEICNGRIGIVREVRGERQTSGWSQNDVESKIVDKDALQILPLTLSHREILLRMYRGFQPLGSALGLPPRNEECRVDWIDYVLRQRINLGTFSAAGDLTAHSFLAISGIGEAEIALFVRQEYRRRGIGANILKRTLQCAAREGLHRIWAVTAAQDFITQGVLKCSGFLFSRYMLPAIEFDIQLQPRTQARDSNVESHGW
jgi:GNAT superfamily N-acetyltransferase